MYHTTHTNEDGTFSPAIMIVTENGTPQLWVDQAKSNRLKSEDRAAEIAHRYLNVIRAKIQRDLVEGSYKEM